MDTLRHQGADLSPLTCTQRVFLLSLLTILVLPTSQSAVPDVPAPFQVVWNYPDDKCQNHNIDLEVTKYGMTRNTNNAFLGDSVSTFYTNHENRYGLWPFLRGNNAQNPANGGIPQLVNMTAHLERLLEDILPRMGPTSHGYGVLDMEMWRPLLDLNWGDYGAYALASDAQVRREHPEYQTAQIRPAAAQAFNLGARTLMVKSIEALQTARPNVHWGYYMYPKWWSGAQVNTNNRLAWLYRTVNGLYPSIYIYSVRTRTPAAMKLQVEHEIRDAFRVKSQYSPPNTIIAAYTKVQNGDKIFFNQQELYYAIGMAADMGVDGVIIWGSSDLVMGAQVVKCNNIKSYIHDTLGPYVKNLTERLTNCSATRCMGHGRCVKADFVHQYPVILGTSSNVLNRPVRAADPNSAGTDSESLPYADVSQIPQQGNVNFVPYTVFNGVASRSISKSPTSDTSLNQEQTSTSTEPQQPSSIGATQDLQGETVSYNQFPTVMSQLGSIKTEDVASVKIPITMETLIGQTATSGTMLPHQQSEATGIPVDHKRAGTSTTVNESHSGPPNTTPTFSPRETSTANVYSSTREPPDQTGYEDYLCQCYQGWSGHSCEYPVNT